MGTSTHIVQGQNGTITRDNDMNLDIRPMTGGDCHHLVNIDLKSSEFPFNFNDWHTMSKYFPDWKIVIGTLNKTPSAFAVFESDLDERVNVIHKFATLPIGRRLGVDTAILNSIEYETFISGFKAVHFWLSEFECQGGEDPYDMSNWLKRRGYKCTNTEPDMYYQYGRPADCYIFEKQCLYMEITNA